MFTGARRVSSPVPLTTLAAQHVGLALFYIVSGYLGLKFAQVHGQVTLVWAPMGLALGGILLWGNRVVPGIFVGAFSINLMTGSSPSISLAIAM